MIRTVTAVALFAVSLASFAAAPGFTAVSLQKHDAGTFYIDGSLRGYGDLRLLVDTGSSYLVISEQILASLIESKSATYSRQLSGTMADGSTRVIPVYRIAGLRLGTSCWVHDVEAAVFPGKTRPILGMNILAQLAPFTFSASPPELGLQQCQEPVAGTGAEFTAVESPTDKESAEGIAH